MSLRVDVTRKTLNDLPRLVYIKRTNRGESLRTAALIIGCGYPHLLQIEKRRVDPKLSLVLKILDYLDLEDSCKR